MSGRAGSCSKCGQTDHVSPLPKRFACKDCAGRLLCYTCDVSHNVWCKAAAS